MRNTPSPEPGTPTPTSWQAWKAKAKDQFERGDYEAALTSYSATLNPDLHCPNTERSVVLSNMVACRLKIGGQAQVRAAVENAKKCVALNDKWSKGYVRLASAYIALGGHSNDACNALQRALRIDPGNSTARQMLLRELRRDAAPTPSAPPEELDNAGIPAPSAPPSEYDVPRQRQRSGDRVDDEIRIDDDIPMQDRIGFYINHVSSWYHDLSSDTRSFLKLALILLVLYIGLGGRFGFETAMPRGSYDTGNAYDRYYSERSREYSSNHRRMHSGGYGTTQNSHYDSSNRNRHHSGHGWSFDVREGGILSIVIIGGIFYVCHLMGINPLEVFFYLNIFGLGPGGMGMRGGRFRRRRGFGGFRPRRRNRWF